MCCYCLEKQSSRAWCFFLCVGVSWEPLGCVGLNGKSVRYVPEVRNWSIPSHRQQMEMGLIFHWRRECRREGLPVRRTQRDAFWDGLPGKPKKKVMLEHNNWCAENQSASMFLCRAESFSCTRTWSHFCERQFPPLPGNWDVSNCCSQISTQIEFERGNCDVTTRNLLRFMWRWRKRKRERFKPHCPKTPQPSTPLTDAWSLNGPG